jgi:hypothetical protein
MEHPKGVIVIAALFGIAGTYLCAIATVLLISPGAISLMAARHLLYGLELAGPYMMLIGAAVYAVVAWGLLRMHNWARWIAMLIMVISIMPLVPKISTAELGVPVLWYGLQIALRVAIGWYLAQAPSAIDAFAAKAKPRISMDSRG